ncbi:hypothetical protein BDE40_3435 [Litoreibacter halocynthiae]|uniref:Translation initiation factor 2 n=1 Tax=Litoreibacter halocynthiae TaxID=1242689 RepID=A0A4R7LCJ6_9RHOB|nr:hypothetical protein BDE40_3435 [Litoreibacter halocynthiae]
MLRTVTIGSCVSIQGIFVKALENGLIRIKVDENIFEGRPVTPRMS